MSNKSNKNFILLHLILLFYSFAGVLSKLAAKNDFMSLNFIFLYSIMIIILFAYAILWQRVLKKMPLTTAFANKAIVVIWGMIWGTIIFGETITKMDILGSVIVVIGICLVVSENE